MKKKPHIWKRARGHGFVGQFGGRTGKGENVIIISKN